MGPGFSDAYSALYDEYTIEESRPSSDQVRVSRTHNDQRRVLAVRDAVERGIARFNAKPLRADARYLLLLNFDQMVARPLAAVSDSTLRRDIVTDQGLAGMVEDDVVKILERAQAVLPPPGVYSVDDEITGSQILAAVAASYEQLKTITLNVWG
jgi:hypothetical protein